jgi:hypothetical protein
VLVLIDHRPNALAVQALRIDWEARLLEGFQVTVDCTRVAVLFLDQVGNSLAMLRGYECLYDSPLTG